MGPVQNHHIHRMEDDYMKTLEIILAILGLILAILGRVLAILGLQCCGASVTGTLRSMQPSAYKTRSLGPHLGPPGPRRESKLGHVIHISRPNIHPSHPMLGLILAFVGLVFDLSGLVFAILGLIFAVLASSWPSRDSSWLSRASSGTSWASSRPSSWASSRASSWPHLGPHLGPHRGHIFAISGLIFVVSLGWASSSPCTYIYICTHTYIYTFIPIKIYICIHTYTDLRRYYIDTYMHTYFF